MLHHKEEFFSKMTFKNRLQQTSPEQMVYQISSERIGAIAIYRPPEDNASIYIYAQLALGLQPLEEDEVQNLEDK